MSRYGEFLHLTIFGQSHAPAIGMILEGLPAGETIDMAALQTFLDRRAPGRNDWSTPRKEADRRRARPAAGLSGQTQLSGQAAEAAGPGLTPRRRSSPPGPGGRR